jgi:hypothetical protein
MARPSGAELGFDQLAQRGGRVGAEATTLYYSLN